jgi:hypothetical protein
MQAERLLNEADRWPKGTADDLNLDAAGAKWSPSDPVD